MKKILRTAFVLLMVFALAIPVLADSSSAQLRLVTDNVPFAESIQRVTTTAPADIEIRVTGIEDPDGDPIVDLNKKEAEACARKAGAEEMEHLDSFEVEVTKDGQKIRGGVLVNVEVKLPEDSVGKYLYVIRSEDMGDNGNAEDYKTSCYQCIRITDTKMVLKLTSYGTFSLFIADKPLFTTSPQTGDHFIAFILCGAALLTGAGALYAGKRRKNSIF